MTTETNTATMTEKNGEQVAFAETEYEALQEIIESFEDKFASLGRACPQVLDAEFWLLRDECGRIECSNYDDDGVVRTGMGARVKFAGGSFSYVADIPGTNYTAEAVWQENIEGQHTWPGFVDAAPLVAALALRVLSLYESGQGDGLGQNDAIFAATALADAIGIEYDYMEVEPEGEQLLEKFASSLPAQAVAPAAED